jgi:hypothetical protein
MSTCDEFYQQPSQHIQYTTKMPLTIASIPPQRGSHSCMNGLTIPTHDLCELEHTTMYEEWGSQRRSALPLDTIRHVRLEIHRLASKILLVML